MVPNHTKQRFLVSSNVLLALVGIEPIKPITRQDGVVEHLILTTFRKVVHFNCGTVVG